MRIPKEYIKQFQILYKKHFGIDVDTEEAQMQMLALVRLVAIRQEEQLINAEKKQTGHLIKSQERKNCR